MSQETTKFTVTENKQYSVAELKQKIASIDSTIAIHMTERQKLVDIINSMVEQHSLDVSLPDTMELKATAVLNKVPKL